MWLLFALIAPLLWGTGYVMLKPLGSQVSPWIITFIFGVTQCFISIFFIWGQSNFSKLLTTIQSKNLIFWILSYAILVIAGSYCNLTAIQYRNVSLSIVTALGTLYPVVTSILCFIFYKEYDKVYLFKFLLGTLCLVTGTTLLAFSNKPAQKV